MSYGWLRCCLVSACLGLQVACCSAQQRAGDVDPEHAARMAQGLDVFKKQVRPLLEQKCLECHGGKAIEAELDLSDRESLLRGGQSGPAIVPGKSRDSLLVKLVNHQREPHMPHE